MLLSAGGCCQLLPHSAPASRTPWSSQDAHHGGCREGQGEKQPRVHRVSSSLLWPPCTNGVSPTWEGWLPYANGVSPTWDGRVALRLRGVPHMGWPGCPTPTGYPPHGMAGLPYTYGVSPTWDVRLPYANRVSPTQGAGAALHQGGVSSAFVMLTLVLVNKQGEQSLPLHLCPGLAELKPGEPARRSTRLTAPGRGHGFRSLSYTQ